MDSEQEESRWRDDTPASRPRRWSLWKLCKHFRGPLLAVAGLLAAGGVCALEWTRMHSTHELLDRAYCDQRQVELRIAGARPAELRAHRGSAVPVFDRPTALLEAQERIARLLRERPGDVALLDESGVASLLSWSYEDAITSLEQALDGDSRSPEVLNDLATAYFERAEAEHRPEDYGLAFELESRALETEPENPVFLFNRAITAERLFLFRQCLEDWGHYLRVDPKGSWADEARARLAAVRERLAAQQQRAHTPLLSAQAFAQEVDPSDQATWTRVDARIEQYLELALREWLPEAFPREKDASRSQAAHDALKALAAILRERHGDAWLHDLLTESQAHDVSGAVALFSQAMAADNITEDFDKGKDESIAAASLFARQGNAAGAMRAKFEEIYALHFSDAGGQCLKEISALEPELNSKPYAWLNVQLDLEDKICLVDRDALGASSDVAKRAAEAAQQAHYPKLHLRALGFLGDAERLEGRKRTAWRLCEGALAEYWAGSTDDVSGYNIYTLLDDLAAGEDLWRLDVAVDREAVERAQSFRDPLTKAALFVHLGVAVTKTGDRGIAEESFAQAERLLNEAPQDDISENYRVGVDIDRARLAAQTGNAGGALKMLSGLRGRVAAISNDSIQADYDGVFAEAQSGAGKRDLAIDALNAAVRIEEKRRASLRTDADRTLLARDESRLVSQLVELKLDSEDPLGALRVLAGFREEPAGAAAQAGSRAEGRSAGVHPAAGRTQGGLGPEDLPEPSSATVLVYSPLSDGLAIWKLNNQGVTYRRVMKDPQYVRLLVDRFKELCTTPLAPLASVESTSKQLYQILIEPVSDQLRPMETVVIVPGEFFAGVPFEALMDKGGSYLIERHAVVYAAGLEDAVHFAEEHVSSKMRALAVANAGSFPGSHLPRLADVTAEAEDVTSQFQASQLLENQDATFARIRRDLPRAEVFHFAGHTGSTGGHEGLLLSEARDEREKDLVLDLSLLERLKVSSLKLVVLSSCATGKEDPGDEATPVSLAEAFVQRGVRRVVATRWNLDSQAGATLMRQFYRSLLSGKPVAQAMAESEVQALHKEPHPYSWAVYDVLGRQ